MKKTKYIVITSRSQIKCDEDELIRVFQAIDNGGICLLRQGAFNPSFFESIVLDDKWMKDFNEDKKYDIRDERIKEYPKYPDLFSELRAQVAQIAGQKNPNINKLIRG